MRTTEQKKVIGDILHSLEMDMGKLAAEARQHDTWIVPTTDDINLPYDEYEESEKCGWRSTTQYICTWRERILDALCKALSDNDLGDVWDDGEWRVQAVMELEDAFWEAWFGEHKLYSFWKKHQKKGKKNGKTKDHLARRPRGRLDRRVVSRHV